MTKTILLTGATGFVGRQVLRNLVGRGEQVCLVVREGTQNRIENHSAIKNVIVTNDIFAERADWWAGTCRNIDTIIHVAWYAEPSKYLQSPKNMDCLIGTLEMAKGAAATGVRRFVGVGTCFEYDLKEGTLSTQTPLKPLTPYAATKAALFMALSQWLPQQEIEFAWCRLFYLQGEGEDNRRLVPYLRKKIGAGETAELTNGKQVRDFMNVQDAGRRIAEIANSKTQGPVNVCSGQGITVRALAEQIADEFGRRDLLHFGAREENLIDPPCVIGIRSE